MLPHVERQWSGRTFATLRLGSEPGSATRSAGLQALHLDAGSSSIKWSLLQVLLPTDILCVDAFAHSSVLCKGEEQ